MALLVNALKSNTCDIAMYFQERNTEKEMDMIKIELKCNHGT
jgi:hypothetical protein